MKIEIKKNFIINFLYFAICITGGFLLFKFAANYLLPFFLGVLISFIVQKPARFLSQKTKIKKQTLASILSVTFFVFTVIIIVFFGWLLYKELLDIANYFSKQSGNIKNYFEKILIFLEQTVNKSNLKNILNDTLSAMFSKISYSVSSALTSIIKYIPKFLVSSLFTVVATCYISKDYDRLLKFLKGFLNDNFFNKIVEIKTIIVECCLKFTIGYFWLFLITFCELLLGLFIIGVNNYFILALLIAFVDLLPILGTGVVLLPWAVVLFIQKNFLQGVCLVILYLIIVIVKNFAEPKIIGKQIGINPLFTLVFIFLGLKIGGLLGMLVLPITFTVVYTYYRRKIYDNNWQQIM